MDTKEKLTELVSGWYKLHKETLSKADSLTNSRDWVNAEKQLMKAKTILSLIADLEKVIHG